MTLDLNTQTSNTTVNAETAAPATRKPASNYNGSEAKILDQLVIAAVDNANVIRDAVVFFANHKTGGTVYTWQAASLTLVFRKRESATDTDYLAKMLSESSQYRALLKARVDADADKTEQGKELKRDVDRRIAAARTNVSRALQAVFKIRADGCKSDVKTTKKGLIQYHDKDGEAVTASASVLVANGSKVVAEKIGKQKTRATKSDAAPTNNTLIALQAALGRVLTANKNNVPLANVPLEGTYWAALYLALADNMRLEKSDGGKVQRRAASTLLEGSTIKALEAYAKEAMNKATVNPASPNANKVSPARKSAKVGR